MGSSGENDPQKVKIPENTCLEGTSSRQTASFEPLSVEIGSRVWAVRVASNKKQQKRHATRIFHHHVGAPPLIQSLLNLAELVNRVTLSILPFELKQFIIVTLVSG